MNNARNIAFWVVLLLLILALFNLFSGNQSTLSSRSLSYSDFIAMVDGDKVASVTLDGERVVVKTRDGEVMAKTLLRKTALVVELESVNPSHPPRTFPASEIDWMARIVWASQ